MKILLLFIALLMANISNGQEVKPVAPAEQAPGTISILCEVLSMHNDQATIRVHKILGVGQGIINPLSEGDTVQVPTTVKEFGRPSQRLVAQVKEKFGQDPNKSEYTVINVKKPD